MSTYLHSFARSVDEHFTNPPSTWLVQKKGPRAWALTHHDGTVLSTEPTRHAAQSSITDGPDRRIWQEKDAWYRLGAEGRTSDHRSRLLTTDEQQIVRDRLAGEQ